MRVEKILVVDDEPIMREFLTEALRRKRYFVESAENGKVALTKLKKQEFDLVITDMKMPFIPGTELVKEIKKLSDKTVVIVMTAFGTIESAVEAMREGAFHYLLKPFTPDAIEALIEKVDSHLQLLSENAYLRDEMADYQNKNIFIAESPVMKRLAEDAQKIAKSNASVLIHGESGTGKEVMASYIHAHSLRKNNPYICVNCAAIADTLLESEFFGHEKGSFTGAQSRRLGRFELADRGTLLLDEITEIPISLQPKLLRVIQEREFERVGGSKSIGVDVRLISTSNRNLQEAIDNKFFREDLFYRLNVVPLCLPPLRERKEDIIPLAQHYLSRFCAENKKAEKRLSKKMQKQLLAHHWPGNVRELANLMERLIVLDQEVLALSSS